MTKHFRLMGFYFWILGLFTLGRWALSLGGADYARTTLAAAIGYAMGGSLKASRQGAMV